MTEEPLVRVTGLRKYFTAKRTGLLSRPSPIRAVDGVDLEIRKGETLGLVGESGSGKSTLGRSVLQLNPPIQGSVRFDGIELTTLAEAPLRRMRRRMQMVFQDPYGSLDPRMSVAQIIGQPLAIHKLASGQAKTERVRELLEMVGLSPSAADRYPHEFSGGQRQRIGVARALAVDPDFIVADEPVSALDVSIQAQLLNLLVRLQAELGLTFLFIAHDLAVVSHVSDRVAVMYLGKIAELASRLELYREPLHPYTVALLSAIPIPDPKIEAARQQIVLVGDLPSASDPPPGCRFNTRCWLYTKLGNPEVCRVEEPPLRQLGPDHVVACHWAEETAAARGGRS